MTSPDFKGIKTECLCRDRDGGRQMTSPDFKGIKTVRPLSSGFLTMVTDVVASQGARSLKVTIGGLWRQACRRLQYRSSVSELVLQPLLQPCMYVQTIVCFANSRKNGNRCIAGKALTRTGNGVWVRPVGRDATRGLSQGALAYLNGRQPALMDVVQIPLDSHVPDQHQSENYLLSENRRWIKTGHLQWADIGDWLDTPQNLWGLGYQSAGMRNNRLPEGRANGSSLLLIGVPRLQLRLVDSPTSSDPYRRMVVGEFMYNGVIYRLSVTDPEVEAMCRAKPGGLVEIAHPVLCLSLGVSFHQYQYKLIAGVIYEGRFS